MPEPSPAAPLTWVCRDRVFACGARTLVMGILNVTPDSFSDGGRFLDPARALDHALAMQEDGADIIDVGGESTRPGSQPVSEEEEVARVVPVIRALAPAVRCAISVDTTKAAVAQRALEAGACIVNDVSALRADPQMAGVAASSAAGIVLMHMQGTPATMQIAPSYRAITRDLVDFFSDRMNAALAAGSALENICLDPGIGFGKTTDHNFELLASLPVFARMGRPLLVGASRKSFLGAITGRDAGGRLAGSLAAAVVAAMKGAHILRVHDVKETCDAVRFVDKFGTCPANSFP